MRVPLRGQDIQYAFRELLSKDAIILEYHHVLLHLGALRPNVQVGQRERKFLCVANLLPTGKARLTLGNHAVIQRHLTSVGPQLELHGDEL
jgi:hypothetical protein